MRSSQRTNIYLGALKGDQEKATEDTARKAEEQSLRSQQEKRVMKERVINGVKNDKTGQN